MSEKISAVIRTYNEAANIGPCIESLAGVDEVVINDDGSTDGTVEIAESLGARVIQRHDHTVEATGQDVLAFAKRFGWNPNFIEGYRIENGDLDFNEGFDAASHDWIVCPDADERVTWDLPRLRSEVLPTADQVTAQFVHSHDEAGNPHKVTTITKMFRRSVTHIAGRTHSVILPHGRIVVCGFMRIDHWQVPRPNRHPNVLPIMEYSVLKEDDQRSRFYLGREYYYYQEYDKALAMFDLYLQKATWMPEIAQTRLYAARCYWASGRGNQARESCLQAVLLNPDHKDALYLMSECYYEPWKSKWKYIADNATDKDVLF